MKHIKLLALLAAALFACGGPDATLDTEYPVHEDVADAEADVEVVDNGDGTLTYTVYPGDEDMVDGEQLGSELLEGGLPEIGTASQALSAPAGYGQESGDSSRCFTPWGFCFVPVTKTLNAAFACNGNTEAQQECLNAKVDGLNSLHNGTGFNYTNVTITSAVRNSVVQAGTVAGNGLVRIDYVTQAGDVSKPEGIYRRWSRCTATVDVAKLTAQFTPTGVYQNPNETVRRSALYNLHMRGWGFCGGGLGTQSSNAAEAMFSGFPSGGGKKVFTSTERGFMSSYSP